METNFGWISKLSELITWKTVWSPTRCLRSTLVHCHPARRRWTRTPKIRTALSCPCLPGHRAGFSGKSGQKRDKDRTRIVLSADVCSLPDSGYLSPSAIFGDDKLCIYLSINSVILTISRSRTFFKLRTRVRTCAFPKTSHKDMRVRPSLVHMIQIYHAEIHGGIVKYDIKMTT